MEEASGVDSVMQEQPKKYSISWHCHTSPDFQEGREAALSCYKNLYMLIAVKSFEFQL